ncbi:hypothetical protein V5799_011404 [Amblyomma americanum]|uniref:Nose resistant-to-fluoxetine protein N-terminal domain-containing protein n=1 Tax=Amblyomma americanum TaxID=6943 RepID=A0AAQ4EHZ9_AMBAM
MDSSGKIPDGVLEGTLVALGSYNECVDIVARDEDQEREYFRGQYCALDIKPFLPPKPKKYNPQHMFRNISEVLPILKASSLVLIPAPSPAFCSSQWDVAAVRDTLCSSASA